VRRSDNASPVSQLSLTLAMQPWLRNNLWMRIRGNVAVRVNHPVGRVGRVVWRLHKLFDRKGRAACVLQVALSWGSAFARTREAFVLHTREHSLRYTHCTVALRHARVNAFHPHYTHIFRPSAHGVRHCDASGLLWPPSMPQCHRSAPGGSAYGPGDQNPLCSRDP
jgi:hypothetical protein